MKDYFFNTLKIVLITILLFDTYVLFLHDQKINLIHQQILKFYDYFQLLFS